MSANDIYKLVAEVLALNFIFGTVPLILALNRISGHLSDISEDIENIAANIDRKNW